MKIWGSISIAVVLPILALMGIFWGDGMKPWVYTSNQNSPLQATIRQENGVMPAETEEHGAQISDLDATQPSPEAPSSPDGQAAPQNEQIDASQWKEFIASYTPEPATLPISSFLTSSSSLFISGTLSPEIFPIRNWQIPFKDFDAKAVIAIEFPDQKILYQKNIFAPLPIASISKLLTALVITESIPLEDEVSVSQKALDTEGDGAGLILEEKFSVEQLLHAMLLASSNDAAVALQETYDLRRTEKASTLIAAMNQKSAQLGLEAAFFEEPSGLSEYNTASALDVARLLDAAYENDVLRAVMAKSLYETTTRDGVPHRWVNSNTLLGAIPGVIAGKTGYTEEAGECMTILTQLPGNRRLVTVVLGSTNRIQTTTNLISWIKEAYAWE